jgi:hypothetical protein
LARARFLVFTVPGDACFEAGFAPEHVLLVPLGVHEEPAV